MRFLIWSTAGVLGIVLGILCNTYAYSPDAETKIQGIPLPLAIFKYEEGRWVDYVGPGWVLLVNFIAGLILPFLIVAGFHLAGKLLARRKKPAIEY